MRKKYKNCLKVARVWMRIVLFLLFIIAAALNLGAKTPIYSTDNEYYAEYSCSDTTHFGKCGEIMGIRSTNHHRATEFAAPITTLTYNSPSEQENETLPEEYGEFISSLPDDVLDSLPEGVAEGDRESLLDSAKEGVSVTFILTRVLEAFGSAISELLPILALLCGIVILSAVAHLFSVNVGAGLSSAVTLSARLCSYCAISGVALSSISRLSEFFDSLCAAVGAFLPLSGVLYAMGGNLTSAASGTATLSAILAVCQLLLTETVIPVFCICLSLTLLSVFDGVGGFAGQSVSATVKKWYTTALGFVMMILTTALAAQSILSIKADNAAMRGVKLAASSFIPVSGGAVSSTLGTLAASVELLRGSVGVVGIVIILLMLVPVILELAILRGIFSLTAFMAGMLGCSGEQRLLNEISSLYGYLEGISALASVVFLIAFAIFASTLSAV